MPNKDSDEDQEYFEQKDLKGDVQDTDDGGAVVKIDDRKAPGTGKFYANLAESMDENELTEIGRMLCDLIDRDKRSRQKRDEQYEEGVRRTGLGDDAPGGAQFMGATKVVHPMLTEACVDFAARAMKEIFPANGPAKAYIAGDPTDVDIERGNRLADYLNYQAISQIPEFRSEMEQMCTQLPLGGGQYIKCTWNDRKKRPSVLFVPIDDVYLPYAASNFYTAERKTHVQYVTALEFEMRVESGMYRDMEVVTSLMPELSKTEEATEKVEGKEADAYNEDGLRTIYECFCMYELKESEGPAPYIISIDKNSAMVLSIYRNWDEEDDKKEELDWMVEFPFVPWRGAYPIGLVHMIGGLSGAATGALRALLDSAHINNFPGLLKLKGGAGGQTERIDPTQVLEIEGSIQDDDVRKLIMPMPFSPPSPVLFELLGFLVDAGKSIIRTSMEEMADTSQDVPVGTTMARLEQGMMVFSAIHGRMHDAMGKLLKVLYRVNKYYLEEKEVFDDTGKLLVRRKDFEGPMTVVPVSDPNIFSESQRFAQIQLVAQRAAMLPQLYDLRKVEELILERMKIPNVEELLLPKQQPEETNAVNENIAATMGRPIVAYPEQDHEAHLMTHVDFMTNPMLGMSQMIGPAALPILLEHIKEHIVLWYATQIYEVGTEAAGIDISELQKKATVDEKKAFDKMLSLASKQVTPLIGQRFASIPQIVQQAQQFMQKVQQQQQPQDPQMQLGMAQIQADKEANAQKMQIEQQKIAQQMQVEQLKMQHAAEIEQLKAQIKGQELQIKGQSEATKIQSQQQIEGAKLTEQSRQADQVIQMESMKQQEENKRTEAELQTQIILAEKKFAQDAQLKQLEGAQQAQLSALTHEQTKEQKHMDIQSTHALEDKKAQSAQQMEGLKQQSTHALEDKKMAHAAATEGMKQESAHALEDKKQAHAKDVEGMKMGGQVELEGLKQTSAHALEEKRMDHAGKLEKSKMAHEEKKQMRDHTVSLFTEGQKQSHEKQVKAAEMDHASKEGEKEREHGEQLETKKAEHDMEKTKHVEKNKSQVADKQLKLKEKEGKEQLKIKQEESKHGLGLKEQEAKIKQSFMKAEGQLTLAQKKEQAKLESQYSKEEHKGKVGLLKTKTKLTEAQLKEKAKMKSAELKKPKPKGKEKP